MKFTTKSMAAASPCPDDSDPFPFGKHKDKTMVEVPAEYIAWVVDQIWAKDRYPEIVAYAEKHKTRLKSQIESVRAARAFFAGPLRDDYEDDLTY